MGAPTQEEVTAYQVKSDNAQMTAIQAEAAVAEAQEALAYRQAESAAARAAVARLNVDGARLQQRMNFAKQAAASVTPIVRTGSIPGLRG